MEVWANYLLCWFCRLFSLFFSFLSGPEFSPWGGVIDSLPSDNFSVLMAVIVLSADSDFSPKFQPCIATCLLDFPTQTSSNYIQCSLMPNTFSHSVPSYLPSTLHCVSSSQNTSPESPVILGFYSPVFFFLNLLWRLSDIHREEYNGPPGTYHPGIANPRSMASLATFKSPSVSILLRDNCEANRRLVISSVYISVCMCKR